MGRAEANYAPRRSHITYYLLPTTYYLPPTTYYLRPTTYHLLPTTHYLLHCKVQCEMRVFWGDFDFAL